MATTESIVRNLTGEMTESLAGQTGSIVHLFDLQFENGSFRACSGNGNLTFEGNQYTAVGGFLGFETIIESSEFGTSAVRLILDGVDQSVVSAVLGSEAYGRPARIIRVHLDESGQIIDDPIIFGPYFMNGGFTLKENHSVDGPVTARVTTLIQNRLAAFARITGIRTNLNSHQEFYPGDKFFQHVPGLVGRKIEWAKERRLIGRPGGGVYTDGIDEEGCE